MCSEYYSLLEQMSEADGGFPSIVFVRSSPSFVAWGIF
jgi:hypothetical protein